MIAQHLDASGAARLQRRRRMTRRRRTTADDRRPMSGLERRALSILHRVFRPLKLVSGRSGVPSCASKNHFGAWFGGPRTHSVLSDRRCVALQAGCPRVALQVARPRGGGRLVCGPARRAKRSCRSKAATMSNIVSRRARAGAARAQQWLHMLRCKVNIWANENDTDTDNDSETINTIMAGLLRQPFNALVLRGLAAGRAHRRLMSTASLHRRGDERGVD